MRIKLIVTLIVINLIAVDLRGSLDCPDGWIHLFEYKCVYINETKSTFNEYSQFCQRHDSNMLTVNSTEENNQVNQLMRSHEVLRAWLGSRSSSLTATQDFRWAQQGSPPIGYHNWAANQPNCPSDQLCCLVINSKGTWFDSDCDEKEVQICEKLIQHQESSSTEADDGDDNVDGNGTTDSNCFLEELEIVLNASFNATNTSKPEDDRNELSIVQIIRAVSAEELIKSYHQSQMELLKQWVNLTRTRKNPPKDVTKGKLKPSSSSSSKSFSSSTLTDLNLILTLSLVVLLTLNSVIFVRASINLARRRKTERQEYLDRSRLATRYNDQFFE